MPKAPADEISAALKVSVLTSHRPDYRGNSLRNGGLLGYYEFVQLQFSFVHINSLNN